jgi:hypothetical protein
VSPAERDGFDPADLAPYEVPSGASALADIETYLRRFVAYPSEHACVAHVLWIAHAHRMDLWESTPRLAFLSPEPGSGKSRALEVTEPLVPMPVHAVNTTPAYLFRKVAAPEGLPTLLYDEIDTVFGPKAKDNEDGLRGFLLFVCVAGDLLFTLLVIALLLGIIGTVAYKTLAPLPHF